MIAEPPAAPAAAPIPFVEQRVAPPPKPATPAGERLLSLDAYRGFVMLLMISAGLGIPKIAAYFPGSGLWKFLAYETEHAEWRGCSLWDLIQPSFMFIVGVAVPYSLAARRAKGDSFGRLGAHALWRAFALIALGVFLSSGGHKQTNYSFAIVLAQIGFGYPFLWLLAWGSVRTQAMAAAAILLGYWALFALWPITPASFDSAALRLPANWNFFQGFEAHWQKNANPAAAFDQWFLNLFPREERFAFNAGGYQTLNFIPSLATMIMGLITGGFLRTDRSASEKTRWLAVAGVAALVLGWLWDVSGTCPMVKRIWTPSFAVFSAGWALLLLAAFYGLIEVCRRRAWAFPFVVAGMNSIALYCMSQLLKPWVRERLKLHLGNDLFRWFGDTWASMLEMIWILAVLWLVAWWMYRRRIFLRI
jgi:predicted acyltransferase